MKGERMEFSVQATLGYRVQQQTILSRLPADHCIQEISSFPVMRDQSAPWSSGIAQPSPRNETTNALTHWPHWARQPQAA
jgi:hypothetical protein